MSSLKQGQVNPIVKKILKIFGWIVACVLLLIVLVLILIQVPAVQQFAKNKAVSYLEKKIGTRVSIGRLDIAFPKQIVLKDVYFEDQHHDTLLAGKELRVDIAMFKLLNSVVDVNYLALNGIRANIYRVKPDTVFNFQYIVDAFASEQKTPPTPKDTTSSLTFHLNKIEFNNILATFKDDETGNDVYFYLGKFHTTIDKFDLDHSIYSIPTINIANINARVYQYKPLIQNPADTIGPAKSPADNPSAAPQLSLGTVDLRNINFNYKNDISALLADLKLGNLTTHPENINLESLLIKLKDLQLNNTTASVTLGKSQEAEVTKDAVANQTGDQLENPWKFQVLNVDFNNNNLNYDDNNKPHQAGMDFSHLHIKNFTFKGDSLVFTPTVYGGRINQLAFSEQSGFDLQKFQTHFLYSDTATYLQDMIVQTDNSYLNNNVAASYPSADAFTKDPERVFVNININHSYIGSKDIFTFVPAFKRNTRQRNFALRINAAAKGYLRDISIPVFELSGIGSTDIAVSGNIRGLPDAKKAYYNVTINRFHTTKNDIQTLTPPGTLPNSVRLPDVFDLRGFFKGGMNAFNTQLALRTNRGNIDVNGSMSNSKTYNAKLTVANLQAGYLMKQEKNFGNISLTATVNGSGTSVNTADANFTTNVISAQVKGYTYNNLVADGSIRKGAVQVTATITDPNIALHLNANSNLNPKYPPVQLDLAIDTLNLKALNLMTDTFSVKGRIVADIPVSNPDSLVGTVNINNLALTQGGRTLNADSISLVANATPQQKTILINAGDAINASLVGQYKLTEIAQALQHTINQYYNLPGFKEKNFTPENWELNARIAPKGLVLELMPDLKGSDSIVVRTAYNSTANDLNLMAKSGRIIFGTQQIDSLNVNAQTTANALNFGLSVDAMKASALKLYKTTINGAVANNKLNFALNVRDQDNKSHYELAGLLQQVPNGIRFGLNPDSVILDYTRWVAGTGNFIQYDSTGILVHNFTLSNNGQSLAINSTPQTVNAPIQVQFTNFDIGTLTKIANQDSLLVGGTINGTALVSDVMKSPVFTSNLLIDNLSYKTDTIGNVAIKVNNQQANTFAASVSITGNQNDIQLNGTYRTGTPGDMDLKLDLNAVNLAMLKGFATGQLNNISGFLRGHANIQGTTDKPTVNGSLSFDNAVIVPTITGSTFRLSNETINIDPQGIRFNNFTLLDSASNKAVIDGDILTTDFKNYRFGVDLVANNFMAVNAPQTTDQLFYGKLNIDANIKLRGDMTSPTAEAYLRVNRATDFTVVLPASNPQVQSREGVVKFVDKSNPGDTILVKSFLDTLNTNSNVRGIDVTANIETDSLAQFHLALDPRSGDAVTIMGRADLAGGIDKSGKVSLTGNYIVHGGSYDLSMSFLKRKFDIAQGSTITWTGDPKLANIDITAVYNANIPPIDLVGPAISGRSQAEINTYKQKLPFNIDLRLTGELLQPIVTFDITLPQDVANNWPDVTARLQQIKTDTSELNKQVFGVLLLGHFVGEDPLSSQGGGGGLSSTLRSTASQLLTDQLNSLAGNLIQGVDLNFALNSQQDYTTGVAANRTNLNVGLTKRLLNDRLKVNVGSNFELEGPQNSNRAPSTIAGDVSVDYQLTKDGRYMIRLYRVNEYQGVVVGQVIETGARFMLTFDYNQFKEIFEGRKKAKQQMKKAKNNNNENNQGM